MRHRLQKGYAAVAIAAVAVALLAISMTSPVVSTTADFSIFNSDWNGVSDLAVMTYRAGKFAPSFEVESTGADITVAQLGLDELDLDPESATLVIIGPSKSFTDLEGVIVGNFVREGGVLLLADDFGSANSLLEGMGASSRFTGDLVMDLAFEKQPEFSVCFDIREDPVTTNVTTVLMNYPSSLTIDPDASKAIAYSSIASWRDVNGNSLQDYGEPRGPFPVLARESLGLGEILLLSDPSVLINGMGAHMDNRALATNIIDEVSSERAEVFFDESHRDFFDPIAIALELTGEMSTNAKVSLVALAFVVTLWVSTDLVDSALALAVRTVRGYVSRATGILLALLGRPRQAPRPKPMTSEEVHAKVIEAHPDWRPGLIRYIMRETRRHSDLQKPKGL